MSRRRKQQPRTTDCRQSFCFARPSSPRGSQAAPEVLVQDRPASPPPVLQLLQYFLLETQISIPKWTLHAMHLHQGLLLIPIRSSSLINKPTLQTPWLGTSFKTTCHQTAHHQCQTRHSLTTLLLKSKSDLHSQSEL